MKKESKKTIIKVFVFIDTNIFIDAVFDDSGKKILNTLKNKLDKNELIIILPDVIKVEINNVFEDCRDKRFLKISENLSTKHILGIPEETVGNNVGKPKQANKNEITNSKQTKKAEHFNNEIDKYIVNEKEQLINRIKNFYILLCEDINSIFNHKNTETLPLTNKDLLKGIKRSLLKKAPYTNKNTENPHTKDIDCIAFESIISFVNSHKVSSSDKLIMCVKEKDYVDEDGKLKKDIIEGIGKISNDNKIQCDDLLKLLEIESQNKKSISSIGDDSQDMAEPSLAIPSDNMEPVIVSSNT